MAGLIEVGILVMLAALAGVVANRFKTPPVLALLLIGAIVGPNALQLVSQTDTVELFSEIGAVLLLFAIGAEFSTSKLAKLGIRVLAIATLKLAIVFFLAFQLALLLGFTKIGALYVGAIIAITSTALMIKIAEQKNFLHRSEVPILIATLVIEDVFAVFALTVFSSLESGPLDTRMLAQSIIFSIIALVAAYVIARRILNWALHYLIKYQAAETMTLVALSLGVGFSYFAQIVGLTPSIGAFLAGSIVASLPKGDLLEKSISPFILAFSSIFFLSIGMLISFNSIQQNFTLIIALVIANIVLKFFASFTSTYLFGFTAEQAAFSGLAMLSVGEFSLIIARQAGSAVQFDLVGATAAMVFFSTLASALTIGKFKQTASIIRAITPAPAIETIQTTAKTFNESMQLIEKTSKNTFQAAMQNASYWVFGTIFLAVGVLPSLNAQISKINFAGITLSQFAVLASSLSFALGIQHTILSLARKPTKEVARFSRIASLIIFFLILPFIASSLSADLSQTELLLFSIAGVITLYALYSGRAVAKEDKRNIMFFKKR